MKAHLWLNLIPLVSLLLVASAIDLRQRRIPNWLTLAMMLTGLVQGLLPMHLVSPFSSLLGLLAAFALMVGQFALGGLGGGDVKLLMGVGAWLGPLPMLAVFACASVLGLFIVLAQAAWQGRMRQLLGNSALLAVNLAHLRQVGLEHARATGQSCRSVDRPLPYAVPVLASVILVAAIIL
jgi:prepilin peptidase CpaA